MQDTVSIDQAEVSNLYMYLYRLVTHMPISYHYSGKVVYFKNVQ